jgi:hypothetical protein
MADLLIVIASLIVFATYRNHWVFEERQKIIWTIYGDTEIKKYISYGQMMLKFWIWDIQKMRKRQ